MTSIVEDDGPQWREGVAEEMEQWKREADQARAEELRCRKLDNDLIEAVWTYDTSPESNAKIRERQEEVAATDPAYRKWLDDNGEWIDDYIDDPDPLEAILEEETVPKMSEKERKFRARVREEANLIRLRREALKLADADEEPQDEGSGLVDLSAFLDGSFVAPTPAAGMRRDDGVLTLYAGKWHTAIALTTAGKSWLAIGHAVAVLQSGGHVLYGHFEEANPMGTVGRLLQLGVCKDDILKRFHWLDTNRRHGRASVEKALGAIDGELSLVVLDGINAACSQHGWPVFEPKAVGEYRNTFVAPAVARGAAVLSLGHPPKGKDRQDERHGFGSTAWLDEVDGVGFRMTAARRGIGRGRKGSSAVYVVKDRYGEVQKACREEATSEGFFYLGSFVMDDTVDGITTLRLAVPKDDDDAVPVKVSEQDKARALGNRILEALAAHPDRAFQSKARLEDILKASIGSYDKNLVGAALELAAQAKRIEWTAPGARGARGGRLLSSHPLPQADDEFDPGEEG